MSEGIHQTHMTDADMEAFVIGALDRDSEVAFEAHLSGCALCAAKLQSEAALEMSLVEVRAAMPRATLTALPVARANASKRARAAVAGVALLAVAATLFAVVRRADPPPAKVHVASPRPSAIPAVVCADFQTQTACVESAHRKGLYVSVPVGAGAPPLGARTSVGPTSPPFPISRRSER